MKRRYDAIIKNLDEQGYITAELVKNAVNGIGQYKRKLLELYREYMEDYAKRIGINRAPNSLKGRKASYKTLQKFVNDCYSVEDIPLKQLDYSFIEKYDSFLRTDMGYSVATVEGYIIKLKTMTRTALAQGTIRYNPFASFIPEKALRKHRHLPVRQELFTAWRSLTACVHSFDAFKQCIQLSDEADLQFTVGKNQVIHDLQYLQWI